MPIKLATAFSVLLNCLAISLLFHIGGTNSFVVAQSFPLSLRRDVPLSPRNRTDFDVWIKKYKDAICFEPETTCTPNDQAAAQARDALIYAGISQIDVNFTKHERGRRHRKEVFETLMDFLKLGADTAAVISNGARAKTIISAGSGLVQLLRESTEKNLRLKETEIIFNRMEADRARVLGLILTKVLGESGKAKKGIKDYPFEAAWIDIVAYYRAGTLDSALAGLSADAASDKKTEQAKVNTLKSQ